jgi:hypothetical protein
MQSRLIFRNRPIIEIDLGQSTGVDREAAAAAALAAHGLRPGQAAIDFLNSSTTEDDR